MLLPADQRIIARDGAISGLLLILDADAFVGWLGQVAPEQTWGRATTTYLRYKPGVSCLAGYVVETEAGPVMVHAVAYESTQADKLYKARQLPSVKGASEFGVLFDQKLGMAAWAFPNDRRLRALRRIEDGRLRRALLRRLLPNTRKLKDSEFHLLAYKPQRRFVAQLVVSGSPAATVKMYTEDCYAESMARTKAFESQDSLVIPRVIGASEKHHAVAYEWVSGGLLDKMVVEDELDEAVHAVERTGVALATLHGQSAGPLETWTGNDEATSVLEVSKYLKTILPEITHNLDSLTDGLIDRLGSFRAVCRPSHGDFCAQQVLLRPDSVGFIDFDEAVMADPAKDLGNFVAHLHRRAGLGDMPIDRVDPLSDALLNGYRSQDPSDEGLPERVRLYEAVALLRLAPHSFRLREADWPERTAAIVEQAARIAQIGSARGTGTSIRPPAVTDANNARADDRMPFLVDACDPCSAGESLRPLVQGFVGQGVDAELHAIKVVRHKPGRRCLIEYDFEYTNADGRSGIVTLIGKARAKGVDRYTFDLMRRLHACGFGTDSHDGICVPTPVGVVPAFSMWVQSKVVGRPLMSALKSPGAVRLGERIASAIYKLHRTPIRVDRRHTMDDELAILRKRLGGLAEQRPDLNRRLRGLLEMCEAAGAGLEPTDSLLIHRDFYQDHVLIDGPVLNIIDLDLACMGDPTLDVGNFVGHLIEWGLRTADDPDRLALPVNALIDAYVTLTGRDVRRAIHTYTTLTLARHVHLSTRFPDRAHTTEPLIELCELRFLATADSDATRYEDILVK